MTKQKKNHLLLPICIIVLLAAYLFIALYYKDHFQSGTFINHVDYSGKTVEEVEANIASEIAKYQLTIIGREGVMDVLSGDDFSYGYVSDGQIEELKKKQNPFKWPISYFTKEYQEMAATCDYDKKRLVDLIKGSLFFQPGISRPYSNAEIISGEDNFYIQKEDYGTTLDMDKVIQVVMDKIGTSEIEFSLEEENCYINPTILSKDKNIQKAVKLANLYTGLTITYDFGDRS
ncbi:MAG: hypothetical protein RR237_02265, partial [Acetivibrio sp.]